MGNRIIIANQEWPVGDDIDITTFLDPGGMSFYQSVAPTFTARMVTNDDGETRGIVSRRRMPGMGPVAELGGLGWDKVDPESGDPMKALRKAIRAVVIHHDGSPSAASCFNVLMRRGYSTHFLIDSDGKTFQAADVADEAIHATVMNKLAIGIDLNNIADNLLTNPNAVREGRTPSEEMTINGSLFKSWNYTDAQYKSLIAILRVLVERIGLQPVFPVNEEGRILDCMMDNPPPVEFKGIMCHWHVQAEKWDPGPGLDWERILAGLREQSASFPVIPEGLAGEIEGTDRQLYPPAVWTREESALSAVASAWKTETSARRMCRYVARTGEKREGGGYFPMGVNQTWHNGIHVPVRRGTLIRPLLEGELVAAHFVREEDFPAYGSNNFVLLRHRIVLPPRYQAEIDQPKVEQTEAEAADAEPKLPENVLTAYSLYMHLDGVDMERPPDLPLFQLLKSHSAGKGEPPPDPSGPTLSSLSIKEEPDQYRALMKGYVGLFSPEGDEAGLIRVYPKDAIGYSGEFGDEDNRAGLVHIEVFADDGFAEHMELGLYGDFLEMGPDEAESRDMRVRSWSLLSLFGDRPVIKNMPVHSDKVLTQEAIQDFLASPSPDDEEAQAQLRRLIVRHVSEWSDQVDWVSTILSRQDWRDRLARRENDWVFKQEVMRYLPYIWLNEDVAKHIGASWNKGVFNYFHPISFLQWWMYRRSAVRGKPIEALLAGVGGGKLSTTTGVPEAIREVMDLPGRGEWTI